MCPVCCFLPPTFHPAWAGFQSSALVTVTYAAASGRVTAAFSAIQSCASWGGLRHYELWCWSTTWLGPGGCRGQSGRASCPLGSRRLASFGETVGPAGHWPGRPPVGHSSSSLSEHPPRLKMRTTPSARAAVDAFTLRRQRPPCPPRGVPLLSHSAHHLEPLHAVCEPPYPTPMPGSQTCFLLPRNSGGQGALEQRCWGGCIEPSIRHTPQGLRVS